MRVVNSDTGFLYFQKIFKQLMVDQSTIVVWQISPDNGKRQVRNSKINSLNFENGKLFLEIFDADIRGELPLYCFVEDGALIFKSKVMDVLDKSLGISIPQEIKALEESEVEDLKVTIGRDVSSILRLKTLTDDPDIIPSDKIRVKSMAERTARDQELLNNEFGPIDLDEEDRLFADKRESPRARPRIEKFVKVAKLSGIGPALHKLFDLSRGGMGFIIHDDSAFSKGEEIHIVGFNDFDLDDPLVGTIMSIRPIDGAQSEFKVGVKFTEGQD